MVIGLLLAPATQAADEEIGAVIQEQYAGAMGIRVTGAQGPLQYQQPVHAEERVLTGTEQSTQLQFLDESRLYVGATSVVVLDKFVYDPASQLGDAALSFSKGAFRFVSGQMQNEEAIRLRTPKTALVIRGTTVSIFLLDNGAEVIASDDGTVGVTACPGSAAESSADLTGGNAAMINYVCELTQGKLTGPSTEVPEFPGFVSNTGTRTGPGGGRQDTDKGGLGPAPGVGPGPSDGDSDGSGGGSN